MSYPPSRTVVPLGDIVSHPSYVPHYVLSTPGELGRDVLEIKAVLNYEDLVYAVVVTKDCDVVLWQAHLPLARQGLVWTATPVITGPTPKLEVDFLCVLHEAAIWVIPVNQPKVVFTFKLGQGNERQGIGHWSRHPLHGEGFAKVMRACSFAPVGQGIYVASDAAHGILDPLSGYIKPFDTVPTALVDDCCIVAGRIFGGDNGTLYTFHDRNWVPVLEAPKATFWACKGTNVYCFLKAKEHGKPLQIALQYNALTGTTQVLDCDFVMAGETPFPYEIPSPIISHGPYFYFFTEDIKVVHAFDVFTFFPHQPVHCQWRQFVNCPKFSDISFNVSGKTFHGHKVLLSCYEYFAKLIDFPQQSCAPGPQVIAVEDVSPEAFQQLLQFLYCGRLEDAPMATSIAIELLCAGTKYLLPALAHKASELLMATLDQHSLADTITILEAAYGVDDSGPLFKKALEVLLERYPDFMAQPEFIQMATHNLEFYKKILRIAMQFMTLDRAKLVCKASCSLTLE